MQEKLKLCVPDLVIYTSDGLKVKVLHANNLH